MNHLTLCSRCKKRVAALFIGGANAGTGGAYGYCLKCASELGLKPVDDMLKQMGLTPDDIEHMEEAMEGMDLSEIQNIAENTSMEDIQKMAESFGVDMVQFREGLGGLTADQMSALPQGDEGDESEDDLENSLDPAEDDEQGEKKSALPPLFTQRFGELFGGSSHGEQRTEGVAAEAKPEQNRKDKKKPAEKKRKFIDNFCEDLTRRAREGKLDKIVGREKEITRAMQILNRRSKNNPCLIGEPGVGKTAIAEGIALDIVSGRVPYRLRGKEVFQLDLTALVAGTQFRGQFESRVKGLLEEVKAAGNIILFVDEVHNLVGAGESEGAMSAANIFKPALSRGDIQVIGATTFTEYRKYIEKDTALERRFQPIRVEEPNIEDAINVLMGVKEYYEAHHRVKVSGKVVRDAVIFSERYITDRFLPDKAIDLLDEACSCCALESKELEAMDLAEKEVLTLGESLDELEAETEIDYEKLAQVKAEYSRAEKNLTIAKEAAEGVAVSDRDLAKVLELWTGISAAKIEESELGRLSHLERRLGQRVIGQDEACNLVADAIKRNRVQITSRRRTASFIFVGPTAVGKTELVKVLADELFDTQDPLIRLDMSEYMEQHSVSKMIGAPPGYVGYDEAGQLTEKVRRKPYSVILLDEIEKAHPNVLNILLQILDEGQITDAQGRKVNFENTVLVMTSNAGSQFKESGMGFHKTSQDLSRDKAMKGLTDFLRPEFISRVDEIVVFNPLTQENYAQIANLLLNELKTSLLERDITLAVDQSALAQIGEETFGSPTGARAIRRVIRKEVEDKIANLIVDLGDDYPKTMTLTVEEGKLTLLPRQKV